MLEPELNMIFLCQNAKENDQLDEENNQLEINIENATSAYCPPCLKPWNLMESGSSSTEPLVPSHDIKITEPSP